jgi:phosphoserine phosphatase RsbU/P
MRNMELKLDTYSRLLIYSHGVFEIGKPDGTMWKFEEFVDYVGRLPADGGLDQLLGHVRQLHASDVLADDFSLLEVRF